MDWLPTERPPGNSEVARLWDLGGTLGKTVVLAVTTFIAYLIGSFLEIGPDGRIAHILRPFALADRRPEPELRYSRINEEDFNAADILIEKMGYFYVPRTAYMVSQSISAEAKRDLYDLFERRTVLPHWMAFQSHVVDTAHKLPDQPDPTFGATILRVARTGYPYLYSMAKYAVAKQIVDEMQQLASRLLVKNQDLYGKYDRQIAEASVRMNISIPLTVLLLLAIWLSGLPLWSRLVLTLLSVAFGVMLLRQGFLRAMSARDVIVQALAIGEVQSRYIPSEKLPNDASKGPAKPEEPMQDRIEDRPSAQ
jgi:hypothetical protein